MKLPIYLPLFLLCSLSTPLSAAEALDFDNETTRINYSLGYQIGGDFKRQGVEMDAEAVVQGILDALEGNQRLELAARVASWQLGVLLHNMADI